MKSIFFLYCAFSFLIMFMLLKLETIQVDLKLVACEVGLEQLSDRVLFQYSCKQDGGPIMESGGKQTYRFGVFAKEEEDESGRYLVRSYGSDKVIEYTFTKINESQSTWAERVVNLNDGKIHFKMGYDDNVMIDLVLEKK